MKATAFAPGNISCLFRIVSDSDPAKAGSLGVGFTVNKGVTASVVSSSTNRILFNNQEIIFPTVTSVVAALSSVPVEVYLESELPLGCGFGLSGASALATAYALNDLFGMKKERIELAKRAHFAEVENGTGLGDVVNQFYGGFLLKSVPSSQFIVERIPISGISVYCKYFSKLPTKDILGSPTLSQAIDRAGEKALEEIKKLLHEQSITFKEIMSISKKFAVESTLLTDPKVIQTISEIESRGGNASMIMLGNAVFSDLWFEGSTELVIQ